MSVRVMTWVWSESKAEPVDRLVLLAIADCANDAGADAYPSMAALRQKTQLAERSIQRALLSLIELGELQVARNAGPKGCNRYRIIMTPPSQSHPVTESPRQPDIPSQSHPPVTESPTPRHADTPTPVTESPGTVLEPSENRKRTRTSSAIAAETPRADVERICVHLADAIAANGSKRPAITNRWRTEARLLLDNDGRTVDQVIRAIDWCQSDSFWRSNVLSMPKLRGQYDRLRLAAQRASPGVKPSTTDAKVAATLALGEELDRKAIGR